MDDTQSLPSHRQFFNSLLDSVSHEPSAHPGGSNSNNDVEASDQSAHEHNRRKLLLTLHVLFPNLLLPALDVLDRKLVTRIFLELAQGSTQRPANGSTPLYVVKSMASTLKRRQQRDLASRSYVVRLGAWNCTCASFTLDAFPPVPRRTVAGSENEGQDRWQSGGLSLDGLSESAPCCKHLLACLLAERWETLQDNRVTTRYISRDELAGIISDT